jgi:hypothetical protein
MPATFRLRLSRVTLWRLVSRSVGRNWDPEGNGDTNCCLVYDKIGYFYFEASESIRSPNTRSQRAGSSSSGSREVAGDT